jgi:hypothetical protein
VAHHELEALARARLARAIAAQARVDEVRAGNPAVIASSTPEENTGR